MEQCIWTAQEAESLCRGFWDHFGRAPARFFSAPGRTELGGNHTDHQHGRVLAAAVCLDTRGAAGENRLDMIRVKSRGYPLCTVRTGEWEVREDEKNTTAALVRGVAGEFARRGCRVKGFDLYVESDVLPGSGLSSSAAFEVLLGTVINALFDGGATPVDIARIGQAAENRYFGKPCGLMDQMASSLGGVVTIDFADPAAPVVQSVPFCLEGYALCIVDCGADHADLTEEYAAIPGEMAGISRYFGKSVLRDVEEAAFYNALPTLRAMWGDRAVLRAIHFFGDNARVTHQTAALAAGEGDRFLRLVKESGYSSWMYLQNVIPAGNKSRQDMAVALALCETLLQGRGAYRVHGGGFAGTVQAFVPQDLLDTFCSGIGTALGEGACHVLKIRSWGAAEVMV